jgi:16S rRNA (guanine527-N7)-methyltransferase
VKAEIQSFLDLLFKWNKAYRLTAFDGHGEARKLGVEPSLAALPHLTADATVLDVGSGGGFPAVPLMIARPDLKMTLTEPSRGKAAFLRETAVVLGLRCRIEARVAETLLGPEDGPWDAITVRGVHLKKGLLRRLAGRLKPGGVLLIWSAGERARAYAAHLEATGLQVHEEILAEGALCLLVGRVPRGTSEPD